MYIIAAGTIGSIVAQDFPTRGFVPPAFETRDTNESQEISGSVEGGTRPQSRSRKITYIAVCDTRDWSNIEGQVIQASMLAFDRKSEVGDGKPLTLVENGRIRLWVKGRKTVTEYPLSKLSPADRKFVEGLIAERQAAAEAKSTEGGEP